MKTINDQYKVNDIVRIRPEWCDSPEEREYLFRVTNYNEVTCRCYIQCINSGMALPAETLVGVEMIEKVEEA